MEGLLAAHREAEPFFTKGREALVLSSEAIGALSANGNDTAPKTAIDEQCGTRVGPYKLLQQIGEGGCGVVYMAEQEEPVRRRVALKIIKLGMDTKSVIARFEAERQALAMMDHPNIACVLDAGATETGRPFFVMELVRGFKITEYCDQNNLNAEQRLELFIPVCNAIQHAHQKGVIHRDIKPSNILVTMHDGKPVPKVIDFGIAKAIAGQTDREDAFHGLRATHRNAGVHESRAGGNERAGHRHPQRHLFARRAALRAAHGEDAVQPGGTLAVRIERDAPQTARRTNRNVPRPF